MSEPYACPDCQGQLLVVQEPQKGEFLWCLGCRRTYDTDEPFVLQWHEDFRRELKAELARQPRQERLPI